MRKTAVAAGVAALLLAVAACGSNGPQGVRGQGEPGGPQNAQAGPGAGGRMPGAVGKVAAVTGSTAQVQGPDGQVAVTWTASTTFTKEVSATLSDVKVGSCVMVGSTDQTTPGSTPATAVTAASVRITAKDNGSCAVLPGGPGGPAGSGGPGGGPQVSGTPPSGAAGQRPQVRGMGGAFGEVTAVSATGFTVASALPGGTGTTTVTVTVGSGTTYSRTGPGAAADVKVGACVAANGHTDDTGAVTATRVAVTQPVDGQCGATVRSTR